MLSTDFCPDVLVHDKERRTRVIEALTRGLSDVTQLPLFGEPEDRQELLRAVCDQYENRRFLYQRFNVYDDAKLGYRTLHVPNEPLRSFLQRCVLPFIKSGQVHDCCHGGEPGWSVRASLGTHRPCASVLSFDIKDAFGTVSANAVEGFFYDLLQGELTQEGRGEIANLLRRFCMVGTDYGGYGLPQGSPVSLDIFNRILYHLDRELSEKSCQRGERYSRWVDDFTISCPEIRGLEEFLGAVALTNQRFPSATTHFPVSGKKTFFQDSEPIFLLGHKFVNGRIEKNTKQERDENKANPLSEDWTFPDGWEYESWT